MNQISDNLAVDFVVSLFERGVEQFDPETKKISNIGGGKLWRQDNPLDEDSSIIFLNYNLRDFIRENLNRFVLFTTSKVILDKQGNPVMYRDRPKRSHNCLMFYSTQGNTNQLADDIATALSLHYDDRIVTGEELKQQYNYDLPRDIRNHTILTEWGTRIPLNINNTIWVALHSANKFNMETGYWTNRSKQTTGG